jgi:hypothetical protein
MIRFDLVRLRWWRRILGWWCRRVGHVPYATDFVFSASVKVEENGTVTARAGDTSSSTQVGPGWSRVEHVFRSTACRRCSSGLDQLPALQLQFDKLTTALVGQATLTEGRQ